MDLYLNRPKCHEFLCELGKKVLYNYDIMTVGETPHVEDPDMALQFVHPDRKEFCMIFPWEHMDVDRMPGTVIGWRPWALTSFKGIINKWQTTMQERGGWNSLYMENHDQGRSISRFGSDKPEFRWLSGKLLAMFLATLSGTLYIFQGQEIGMTNLPSEWGIEEYTDVVSQMHFKQEKQKKIQAKGCSNPDMKNVMTDIHRRGRDHGRSPMQWSGGLPNAGFTTGTPWRKTNPDFTACNVESAAKDPESVLSFWKKLVGLRKTWKTLVYGDFELVQPQDEHLFAYRRTLQGGKDSFILLNFSEEALQLDASLVPAVLGGEFVLGNYQTAGESNILRPWEARLFVISGASY
jgi:oligo-1,6-glucosidase